MTKAVPVLRAALIRKLIACDLFYRCRMLPHRIRQPELLQKRIGCLWELRTKSSVHNLVSQELDLVPKMSFSCWLGSWDFRYTRFFSFSISSLWWKVYFLHFYFVKLFKKLSKWPNYWQKFSAWSTFGYFLKKNMPQKLPHSTYNTIFEPNFPFSYLVLLIEWF